MKTINPKEQIIDLYLNNLQNIVEHSTHLMNRHRQEAIQNFKIIGLPNAKNENYTYSRIDKVFEHDYHNIFVPRQIDFNIDDIFSCDILDLDTHMVLTLNGFYLPNTSSLNILPSGVVIGSIIDAAERFPELIEKYYNSLAHNHDDGLVAMNTAIAQDGVFVYVPSGVTLDRPVQIINLLMSDSNQMVQYRNLIVLEHDSNANVLICDHTLSPSRYLSNVVTEVVLGQNASLELIKMQNEHDQSALLTHTFVEQAANSMLKTNIISLHGGFIRNGLHIRLAGQGASAEAYGLFTGDRQQHHSNATFIEHAVPHCNSRVLYKGILDDQATGAFNGKVLVQPNAQKTEAYQGNHNLLLTQQAKMNTKPQLEIYADDVRCSHGATVGQLDDEALFYMRSRGIDARQAKLLLMFGFAHEVVQHTGIESLRARIDDLVRRRLNGELSRCQHCPMKCH